MGNQVIANPAHALRHGRIGVELFLGLSVSGQLLKALGRLRVDGVTGDKHQLAALQSDGPRIGGAGTALQNRCSQQSTANAQQPAGSHFKSHV